MNEVKIMYYTQKDISRDGWCIFKKETGVIVSFVAGSFFNKEKADSECFRLNELNTPTKEV